MTLYSVMFASENMRHSGDSNNSQYVSNTKDKVGDEESGKVGSGQIMMDLLSHNAQSRLPPEGNGDPLNTEPLKAGKGHNSHFQFGNNSLTLLWRMDR